MRRYAEKIFPFFGTVLVLAFSVAAAFVFLGVCLQEREVAGGRLFLVQRQLNGFVGAVNGKSTGEKKNPGVAGGWLTVDKLSLLRDGGSYAGRRIKPLEDPALKTLLHDSLALRDQFLHGAHSRDDELKAVEKFRLNLEALADALVFQAVAADRRVKLAFWLLALAVALFALLGIAWLFNCRRRRDYQAHRLRVFTLQAAMLRGLPEAWFLLDCNLVLQAATDKAMVFLPAPPGSGVGFEHLCRDPEILTVLRQVAAEIAIYPIGKIKVAPEKIILEAQAGGPRREVLISWYRTTLAGKDYLLGRISDAEAGFLESTDSLAARRLRELAEKFFKVQDEERRRLADELHDGLCQALAVLKMQVSTVERRIEAESLKDECRQARRYVTQIIEDIRRLSHDLSPVILDDLGLSEALVHLVNNFTATHNIKALTSVPDIDDCFSENEARNIYRIVQEAINNIGKHAGASQMTLEVERKDGEIRFSIRDDGVGFDSSHFDRQSLKAGLGMASMVQRVQLMGGEFKIDSQPGRGTEIIFILPDNCRKTGGRIT